MKKSANNEKRLNISPKIETARSDRIQIGCSMLAKSVAIDNIHLEVVVRLDNQRLQNQSCWTFPDFISGSLRNASARIEY